MTNPPPKPPPRFIPTLTEVVQAGNAASPPAAVPRPGTGGVRAPLPTPVTVPPAPARGSSMAPGGGITGHRTASLPPAAPSVPFPPGALAPSGTAGTATSAGIAHRSTAVEAKPSPLPEGFEEFMVHRVMQRVDVMLEKRLRDAIATVVQEQTRSVLPRLREEIESVVRHSVYEAVAEELAGGQPAAPVG